MGATYRAAAIGRTGAGDYGHGLDMVFTDVDGVEYVAIADADAEGLRAAGERTGVAKRYADYRDMLAAERLDLVSVGPRVVDCHADMVIACAEAGVRGIFCEKMLAPTLREADAMIEACERTGARLAVAHRRANPYEQHGKQLIEDGAIGQLQLLRAHGKADRRAGAQDLAVLGTHMMDSMRYYAGADVAWAHAHVTQDGREVSAADVHDGDEAIGLIAGNGVQAYYAFENGVTAHFESHPGMSGEGRNGRWFGFEAYGTEGILSLRNSPDGEMYIYRHAMWIPGDGEWERILLPEWERFPARERTHQSNRLIVAELIEAIEENRDVVRASSGYDGRAALEMIVAAHESQRVGGRVRFPLANRGNPYEPSH